MEWVEKVMPKKEVFFKSTDLKTFALLPDETTFKRSTESSWFICIFSFILLTWFGFEFVSFFNGFTYYSLVLIKTLTCLAVIALEALIIKATIKHFKSSPVKFTITKEYFIYNDIKTEWSDVRGIYAVYRQNRSTVHMTMLKIKLYNRKIIEVYVNDLNVRNEYAPGIFSIYKTYYDCHSNRAVT